MRIEIDIIINRPVEDVFEFTDVIENEVIWRPELIGSEKTTEGPVGVGTKGRSIYRLLGRLAESEWEITEYEKNRKVTFQSDGDNGPHLGTWLYEAVDSGTTKFTWLVRNENELHGLFGQLSDAFVGRLGTRAFMSDLENLKRLLEA
jgi:hypothetical protein